MDARRGIGGTAVWVANGATNAALLATILLAMAYGGYALWDANTVVQAATAKRYSTYKPTEQDTLSFSELQAVNPQVIGWITVYGTLVDYPLLQAEDNAKYINTNAEGGYSLTGAIFLDCANDPHFADFNSIVYGHNMVPEVMFGSIKEFRNADFFASHLYGNLYYDGRDHGIELFAVMGTTAGDGRVYHPGIQDATLRQTYLDDLLAMAFLKRDIGVTTADQLVLMSTCSSEGANVRNVLVGRITDETYPDVFAEAEKQQESVDSLGGVPLWAWALAALAGVGAVVLVVRQTSRRRRREGGAHHARR